MAKHIVKCPICGGTFDASTEPFVKTSSTRYAHEKCVQKQEAGKTQQEKDYEALERYILKLFHKDRLGALITKQIRDFRKQYNYSYSGIHKTLIWWFEIKGNSTEMTNGGIGIVPFVYDDACKYYYSLFLAQLANQDYLEKDRITEILEVNIEPPRPKVKTPRLFEF